MERGEPIWQTSSTSPMSMPNSREAVATQTLTWPYFSFSSAARRVARDRLPWWATTASSPILSES